MQLVQWLRSQSTKYGKFKENDMVEISKEDAKIWMNQGLCCIPKSVEVTYIGNHQYIELSHRKAKITLNRGYTRLVPFDLAERLKRNESRDVFVFGKIHKQSLSLISEKDETIILKYNGNYGDVLRLSGLLEGLSKQGFKVNVRVPGHTILLFENNPFITKFEVTGRTRIVDVDMIKIHQAEQNENELRTNTWYSELGFENCPYRKPSYFVSDLEKEWARNFVHRYVRMKSYQMVIGINSMSSVLSKTWNKFPELMKRLDEEFNVLLLDEIIDKKYKFQVRELGALVNECDLVISNDSLILHLAGALDIYSIGLFGITSGKVICQNYSSVKVVQGKCPYGKDGCWYHTICGKDIRNDYTPCMEAITVEDVIKAIGEIVC